MNERRRGEGGGGIGRNAAGWQKGVVDSQFQNTSHTWDEFLTLFFTTLYSERENSTKNGVGWLKIISKGVKN